jgi:hypothetical protein
MRWASRGRGRASSDTARLSHGQGLERAHRLAHVLREVPPFRIVDPALEGELEHRYPRFAGQAGGGLRDASATQRLGDARREGGELDQLTLLEVGVGGDERVPLPGELPSLLEDS